MDSKIINWRALFWKWAEKIPIPRLKVFHQLLVIIIIMIILFIIQGVHGVYINVRMQNASLDIAKISSKRFNNVILIKTYIELIEKEYIKVLTNRGKIRFLIMKPIFKAFPGSKPKCFQQLRL